MTDNDYVNRANWKLEFDKDDWKLLRRALQAIGLDAMLMLPNRQLHHRKIDRYTPVSFGTASNVRGQVNVLLCDGTWTIPRSLFTLWEYTIGECKGKSFLVIEDCGSIEIPNPYAACATIDEVKVMIDLL